MKDDDLPGLLERPTQTISGQAVDVLRRMVLSGRLAVGERLNEVELAAALGISRGPLREAIQSLRTEGLLTSVSGRGAFVRTFTPDGLRDLYEVRIALETHAIRLIGARRHDVHVAELRGLLDQSGQVVESVRTYPEELDFHHRIAALTGNQPLLDATVEVHRQIQLARTRSGQVSERAERAYAEHERIVEQLAGGDVEKAVAMLTAHLRASLESAIAVLDGDQDSTGTGTARTR